MRCVGGTVRCRRLCKGVQPLVTASAAARHRKSLVYSQLRFGVRAQLHGYCGYTPWHPCVSWSDLRRRLPTGRAPSTGPGRRRSRPVGPLASASGLQAALDISRGWAGSFGIPGEGFKRRALVGVEVEKPGELTQVEDLTDFGVDAAQGQPTFERKQPFV